MKGKYLVLIIIVLLLVLGFLGKDQIGSLMYGSNPQPAPQVTTPTITPKTSPATSSAAVEQNVVTLTANGFSPSPLTVKASTSVTFINKSGSKATVNSAPHPVHTNYPPLNLGSFADGGTLSYKFDKPGTYGYHNHLNPSQTGQVVVQ